MFGEIYRGRKVLITGHTGFKGSWLTTWLLELGAHVCGLSKDLPTTPSHFANLGVEADIEHHIGDVRDLATVTGLLKSYRPDFVFHLAAQPIVSESYRDPLETITSNVVGTSCVLQALREVDHPCAAVIITSDKCYHNVEWPWGYRETDHMGGKDIYSASKGAAELIFHAFFHSYFGEKNPNVRLATARAGNVIGGGDWAKDRIVADCMRAWSQNATVTIRSPFATRPWQHVLEPLSGYLLLGQDLFESDKNNGQSFNFGPRAEQNRTVGDLLNDLGRTWGFDESNRGYTATEKVPFHEAGLLKLNCDKALFFLKWEATLSYDECVRMTSEWYHDTLRLNRETRATTVEQLRRYCEHASQRTRVWAAA